MMYKSLLIATSLSSFFYACTPKQEGGVHSAAVSETPSCLLSSGEYPVQSVSHYPQSGKYELMLLGAPACLKMPYEASVVTLARMEDDSKESALFHLGADGNATLKIKKDFSIQLVQQVQEAGKEGASQTQTSSWAPFLQGAATAAVGGMLVNSLMNRSQPQQAPAPAHVSPQQPQALKSQPHTTQSYQRKQSSQGFFKSKSQAAPARRSGGFFKRR